MSTYTSEQRKNISLARRLARGGSVIVLKALLEAMAVEANFRNVNYGDRDSEGVLQQRPSQGWGPASESAATDIRQFLAHARALTAKGFRGTPGQLAQAVQRSAFPGRYDERASEVQKLLRGAAGAPSAGGIPPSAAPVQDGTQSNSVYIKPPDTSRAFATAFLDPKRNPNDPQALMKLIAGAPSMQRGTVVPSAAPQIDPARQPDAGGPVAFGGYAGKVIGTPYHGTHTLGDWQSDNAIDLAMPVGTPIRARVDGRIGTKIGTLGKSGRFAGQRVYVIGGGDEFYYAHLSRLTVKAGQRVKAGQIIGYSGSANGVAHLHYARHHGDPRKDEKR